ncbi:hypothetical protein E2562_004183 [Oryza meyeriana var. granulata]|uniref:Uncharacterized protein n=1 Tax=Oryza meyeriana var. granulata TaxID=110450 RepID=A0A6G1BSK3_9ORYZ|nr:hypothetical protein E2562_004183 [Oryza meyeriana var. granulata]
MANLGEDGPAGLFAELVLANDVSRLTRLLQPRGPPPAAARAHPPHPSAKPAHAPDLPPVTALLTPEQQRGRRPGLGREGCSCAGAATVYVRIFALSLLILSTCGSIVMKRLRV